MLRVFYPLQLHFQLQLSFIAPCLFPFKHEIDALSQVLVLNLILYLLLDLLHDLVIRVFSLMNLQILPICEFLLTFIVYFQNHQFLRRSSQHLHRLSRHELLRLSQQQPWPISLFYV